MSLALYSAKSKVASKLKANGFEICEGEDEDGNEQINITQDDKPNEYPKFNCLYNKAEVDARVVNDYIENGGSLEGFGDVPITEKSTQILEYRAPENILMEVKSEQVESNRELIKDELCVNTFNDIIEAESKTCEAVHDMYNELMCAADGYEQVVLDEDKGQCDVIKYVQTPTAPPKPSPTEPFLHYKPFYNLADMLMNIMKNEKKNQSIKRILYDVFNETNLTKIINGTKQYHYNPENHTLQTIGYKYKNSTEEVKADQLVEVSSPGEFIDIYTQNQKDNYLNYPKIIQNLLLSSVLGYGLASALKLFTTSLTVDHTIKVDNIDGTKVKVSLNQFLNDVQLNINNIIVSLNYWADYCSKIKSCNCNQDGENNFEDENDAIFVELLADLYDRVDEVQDHLQVHDISRLHFDNQAQLAQSQVVDFSIYNNNDGINDLINQYQKQNQQIDASIKHTNFMNDRSFDVEHDEIYYWSALFHRWVLLTESGYSLDDFPSGWRTNRSFDAPPSFIFDVDRQNWIQIMITDFDNKCQGWRNNEDRMSVAVYTAFMANNTKNKEGDIIWDENENEWIYCNSAVSPLSIDIGTPPKQPDDSVSIPGSDSESFKKALEVYGSNYIEPPNNYQFKKEKPVYGDVNIKANLNVNGLINGVDISNLSSGDSNFTIESGLADLFIENGMITQITDTINNIDCNILIIDVPEERKNGFLNWNRPIFKIVLRKNVIYDEEGRYIKEFYISSRNNKIVCPVITYDIDQKYCIINDNSFTMTRSIGPADQSKLDGKFFIAFDKRLPFDPRTLYINGDLSIMNQFTPTALKTDKAIKCSVIEADNALKLHKSDVHYFYKPSIITEDNEFYKMVFSVDSNYNIPSNLEFIFKEYCFGNTWSLMWKNDDNNANKGYWTGYNCQGCYNKSIKTLCQTTCRLYGLTASAYALCTGAIIMVKDDELNNKIVEKDDKGLMHALWNVCTREFKVLLKDGTEKDASDYHFQLRISIDNTGKIFNNTSYPKYSTLPVYVSCVEWQNYYKNPNAIKDLLKTFERGVLYLTLPDSSDSMRLTFRFSDEVNSTVDVYQYNKAKDCVCIGIYAEYDTIDRIPYKWSDSNIDTTKKDVELYLRKDLVDPIEEVNWDSTTNAFKYIIDQQFYDIRPNPNAATTLYTDYNITSSKIITADNITTMRSDLNVLTNNFDVVSYDVKDITSKVDTLRSEMTEQQNKTQYLKSETDKLEIMAGVALAIGATGTLMGGLSLTETGISFGFNGINGSVRCIVESGERWFGYANELPLHLLSRSIKTDLTPLIDWCNEDIKELTYDANEDTSVPSVAGVFNICNNVVHAMKPTFKMLCNAINEINNDYISKNELVRDDIINVVGKFVNGEVHLEAEDTITDGIIKARFLVQKVSEYNDVDYEENIVTINITGGTINYQGTTDFPSCTMNDKTFVISNPNKHRVGGIQIKENTAKRRMEFTTNDLAYTCDIDALHKKIDTLHEQIEKNDTALATTLNEFPTVDEVNEALDELKNNMVNMDNLYTKEEADNKYRSKNDLNYGEEDQLALKSEIPTLLFDSEDAGSGLTYAQLKNNMRQLRLMNQTIDIRNDSLTYFEFSNNRQTHILSLFNENDKFNLQVNYKNSIVFKDDNKVLINDLYKTETDKYLTESESDEKYRSKTDLKVGNKIILPITNGPYEPEHLLGDFFSTSFIPFQEGAHLVGVTGSNVNEEFDIIFKTESTKNIHDTIAHVMDISIGSFYWEEATGVLYNYSGTYPVRVTLAEFGEEDQIALKSENDELKTRIENLERENTNLKATIEAMESRLAALENGSYVTKDDLSEYRKLNDISYHNHQELSITNKEVLLDDGDEQRRFTTSHIPYHEGTHLIGKYTDPDSVEHSFDIIFETIDEISETQYWNCILFLKQSEISEELYIDWDVMTGAIFIYDDYYGYYIGCEISSATFDEDISLSTSNELINYYTKDELTRFGLNDGYQIIPSVFELSMENLNNIRFKYAGSNVAAVWNRLHIFVFKDIVGKNHFIKFDFIHKLITLDNSVSSTYEIPIDNSCTNAINITLRTNGFVTTQELVSKYEIFTTQQVSHQLANQKY
ncbi:hypothetical protein M9Y10_020671 [Tritrichomonas musculus]|uniref:Uncharacterized protein n=1 Tax=Tritrichomonas musculus TaxID=1915356 RepID=A0ABR2HEE3_9EUKA